MIPKIIHYCWFGRNPKPKLAKKCMKSWKKYCPDYKVIEWNEDNFDISSAPLYVKQAYQANKWAFVTDYVRLRVVFEHGGIYLDTDVEVVKPFDDLLKEHAFFGFEYGEYIATGLGFGAEKNAPILQEMMRDYEGIPFILPDGSFDETTCPIRNSAVFIRNGLRQDDSRQTVCNCLILPSEYLCPYKSRGTNLEITEKTITVHWYSGSWLPEELQKNKQRDEKHTQRKNMIHVILHTPNRIGMFLLGKETYNKLKSLLKRN